MRNNFGTCRRIPPDAPSPHPSPLRGERVPVGRVRGTLHVPRFLRGYIAQLPLMLTLHSENPGKPGRIVVMGAGGFVGQASSRLLKTTGFEVIALTRKEVDLLAV